jgi:hypothetical protein
MMRKYQVRFGGGRLQKGSTTLHLGSFLPYGTARDLARYPQPCGAPSNAGNYRPLRGLELEGNSKGIRIT